MSIFFSPFCVQILLPYIKLWTGRAVCAFVIEDFWIQVGWKVLFRIAIIWAHFASFSWISVSFLLEISELRYFTCCKHLISTTMLHVTGSCPKNYIVTDISGDFSIPKYFAMFCNVNYPLKSAIMIWLSAKTRVFAFVAVDKVIPFVYTWLRFTIISFT